MGLPQNTVRLFCPLLLLTLVIAQDRKESGITLTSRTGLVLVPVVVSDKSNTHIAGLTKDDFEIQEDGKPKPVATLEEIKTFAGRVNRSTPQPGVFSNALSGNSSPKV